MPLDQTSPISRTFEGEANPERTRMRKEAAKPERQRRKEAITHDKAQSKDRDKRRTSFLEKRKTPRPQLRPGPRLAAAPDAAAFNADWRLEQRLAKQDRETLLREGHKARKVLVNSKAHLEQAEAHRQKVDPGNPSVSRVHMREAFKAKRRAEAAGKRGLKLAQAFNRNVKGR